eukprot:gb/GECG01006554.1/.p1 GENE.gb/GECG01006554.1/~~gb/GECG01006554.1/.p1  ORF type:complete len:1134 (+),score=179.90 gb/GECG01006554.1/:1-3402(+)
MRSTHVPGIIMSDSPQKLASDGEAYTRQGDYTRASQFFDAAVKKAPNDQTLWLRKATCLVKMKQYKEGVHAAQKALELKSDYIPAYMAMSSGYLYLGQLQQAVETAEEALKLQPDNSQIHITKAACLMYLGNYEQAGEVLDEALRIAPESFMAYLSKSTVLRRLGRLDKAVETVDKAAELAPESSLQYVYPNKIKTLAEAHRFDEALQCADTALQQSPDSAAIHYAKGHALYVSGDYNSAMTHLRKTTELQPVFVPYIFNGEDPYHKMGLCLHSLGKYDEAVQYFDEALKCFPEFQQAQKDRERALRTAQNEGVSITKATSSSTASPSAASNSTPFDDPSSSAVQQETERIVMGRKASTAQHSSQAVRAPKTVKKLFKAARHGNHEYLKQMAQQGYPLSARDAAGNTVLHKLVKSEDQEDQNQVDQLLEDDELDFELNSTDDQGQTLLQLAVDQGNDDLADSLLGLGADPNVLDGSGKTVMLRIAESGEADLFRYLYTQYKTRFDKNNPANQKALEIFKTSGGEEDDGHTHKDSYLDRISLTFDDGESLATSATASTSSKKHILMKFQRQEYRRALELIMDEEDLEIEQVSIKAKCYYYLGKFEFAKAAIDYSLQYDMTNSIKGDLLLLKAQALCRLHDYSGSFECLRFLREMWNFLEPDLQEAYDRAYIKTLYFSGDVTTAEQLIKKRNTETLDVELLNIRGNIEKERHNNPQGALKFYDLALGKEGYENHPLVLCNRGLLLLEQGNQKEAMESLQHALQVLELGYSDSFLRQVNVDSIQSYIDDALRSIVSSIEDDDPHQAEKNSARLIAALEGDPNDEKGKNNHSKPTNEVLLQQVLNLKARIDNFERVQEANVSKPDLCRILAHYATRDTLQQQLQDTVKRAEMDAKLTSKPDRDELSYSLWKNEEWEKTDRERREITSEDTLSHYYHTFMNVVKSHMMAAMAIGTNRVEARGTNFSNLGDLIPLPAVKEVVTWIGRCIDVGLDIKKQRQVHELLRICNNVNIEELAEAIARKVTLLKKTQIRSCRNVNTGLDKLFASINSVAFPGDLALACSKPAEKLAYKDASKVIILCYSGVLNLDSNVLEQLIDFAAHDERKVSELQDTSINYSDSVRTGIQVESNETGQTCSLM